MNIDSAILKYFIALYRQFGIITDNYSFFSSNYAEVKTKNEYPVTGKIFKSRQRNGTPRNQFSIIE